MYNKTSTYKIFVTTWMITVFFYLKVLKLHLSVDLLRF